MRDAGPLMHAVAGGHQMLLVFVHELRPAFCHENDVELGLVAMPAGAFFRRLTGLHQLRDDSSAGGAGDAKVAVEEEVAQAVAAPGRLARLHVREFTDKRLFEHGHPSSFGPLTDAGIPSAARLSHPDPPSGRFPRACRVIDDARQAVYEASHGIMVRCNEIRYRFRVGKATSGGNMSLPGSVICPTRATPIPGSRHWTSASATSRATPPSNASRPGFGGPRGRFISATAGICCSAISRTTG